MPSLIDGYPTIWNLSPGGSNTIWTPEADLSLPIDDRLRGEIEAAMQSIRDAVSLAGY